MGKHLGFWGFVSFSALLACSAELPEDVASSQQALTAVQERVLGFETPTADWQTNAGTRGASTTRSQGAQSLSIVPNGWTELTSIPLSSLGNVNSTFRYDIRTPSVPIWGETRAILVLPSRGITWADLGTRSLTTMPAGSFQTVTFNLPSAVEAALDATYTDLRIKIIVNAPALSQPYLVDNIVLTPPGGGTGGTGGTTGAGAGGTGGTAGAGTGGTGGTSGTSGGGTELSFSVCRPTEVALADTFMCATDHLTYFSQAVIGQDGATPALASFGGTQTYLQAASKAFGNIYSRPNVRLDAKTLVGGFVRTQGTIIKQGVGTSDAPVIRNGEFPGVPITPATFTWTTRHPGTSLGDVEFFAVPTPVDHVVPPGAYGKFNIHDRNRVLLSSGTYFFDSFNTESQAQILVNKTSGPIVIYVRNSFSYKGAFVENGGPVGQVLVAYSGSSDAFLQAPFVGTMVAPNATIKLERPTSAQHRGSFFGRAVEVAAGLHTVLHLPFDFDVLTCRLGDSDMDGTPDCSDRCPLNPDKTDPGICTCEESEVDSDTDGVPDCVDECPDDADAQHFGICGCPSDPVYDGTPCDDSVCRGSLQCMGGKCGDASTCELDPSCEVRYFPPTEQYYLFCTHPLTWEAARDLCGSVDGVKLAQIDTPAENAFLTGNLNAASMWTGANDRGTDGQWFWRSHAVDAGEQFWTGGATGRAYFARFAAWSGSAPSNPDDSCGRIEGSGLWTGASCTSTAGFICELGLNRTTDRTYPPRKPTCELMGISCDPDEPGDECLTDAEAFGGLSEAEVLDSLADCKTACAGGEGTPGCTAACTGAATPAAPDETCDDADDFPLDTEACGASTVPSSPIGCAETADCPDGHVCSREYVGGGAGQPRLCVIPVKDCGTVTPVFPERCTEVDLCEPANEQTVTTVEDGSADLAAEPFDPFEAFGTPVVAPEGPFPPDDDPCSGSCIGRGEAHPWCHLVAADPTPDPDDVVPNKSGSSSGDLVSFEFNPAFNLSHRASIGAFGLPDIDVSAEAGFAARIHYTIAGGGTINIIDVLAALDADECGVGSDQHLIVFDQNIVIDDPITLPDEPAQDRCRDAMTAFNVAGNRAKKALRDTVELLGQYQDALDTPSTTDNLRADLCRQVAAAPPRGFLPGSCPATGTTESPETTINRFIDYYRRSIDGFGVEGMQGLREAAIQLAGDAKFQRDFQIFSFTDDDEKTIASAQFFIGPIPVFLEVLSTVHYGATLRGSANLSFGPVVEAMLREEGPSSPVPVAMANVDGMPDAGAGLGVFAGVGFGVPGFEVKIGLQANLHVGTIYLPAYAGAGIGLGAAVDGRGPPSDIAPFTTGVNLIQPKLYVPDVQYTAGLGIKVRDILNGSVSGKLKISVLFFSKSWRKTLMNFKGICSHPLKDTVEGCDFDLITLAGSTDAAVGGHPLAEIRMTTPFPELAPLVPGASTPGTGSVGNGVVEEFFFDGLCTCIDPTDTEETRECFRSADCCPEFPTCFHEPGSTDTECITCRDSGQTCNTVEECCGDPTRVACQLGMDGRRTCVGLGFCHSFCNIDAECDGLPCVSNECFTTDACVPT